MSLSKKSKFCIGIFGALLLSILLVCVIWNFLLPANSRTSLKVKLLTYQLETAESLFDQLCKLNPSLKIFIRHPELEVRLTAAKCLGEIGSTASDAVPKLIPYLKKTDEYDTGDGVISFRSGIARALGEIGDDRAIAPLIDALKSSKLSTKSSVAEALGNFGPKAEAAVPFIIPLLSSETPPYNTVAQRASESLGKFGASSSVSPLIEMLKSGKIISGAVCSLVKLAPKTPDVVEVIQPLVTFKNNDDTYEPSEVRTCATRFMQQLKK